MILSFTEMEKWVILVENEDLQVIIDKINPLLSYGLIVRRYDALKSRVELDFSKEDYVEFCRLNEIRRYDSIFLKENCCSSPKTLSDFTIRRGGFHGGLDLIGYSAIKSRYSHLLKKHGYTLGFSFDEFRAFCEKMQIRGCDSISSPKRGTKKIRLSDLILRRNVRSTIRKWY